MGGLVPATLAGHTTPETAVAVDGTLSIKFAQDGSDAGFIQSVPLKFSATGEAGSYVSEIPNGWTYVKRIRRLSLPILETARLRYMCSLIQ